MSGDVQPRKRKDKKRKKDDSSEQLPTQPQTPPVLPPNDDLNIHVHKEDGTGGGICAKIVFFFLFSALAVLIGLIITEHRGLTDLDTVDSDSRFSQLFEGWIDNSPGHEHEDDHLVNSLEDDDHDDDEQEESHEIEDDDHEEEEEEEEEVSEEQSEPDEDDDEEEEDQIIESDEDDESAQRDDEDEDEDEVASEEKLEDDEDDEDESENVNEDDDEEQVESKEQDVSEEQDASEERDVSEEQDASEEQNVSEEQQEASEEQIDEKEDNNEPDDEEVQEIVEESENKPEGDENQENSRMAVKIGVGVALLVVAHVVLVKKWKSATPEVETQQDETLPDLSRRATIVVPPTFQEVQQDIEENIDEEYSDEDGEIESDDDRLELKSAKLKYQELRTTYSRSLTPESEPEYQNKPTEEDEEEYDEEVEEEEEEIDEDEGDEEDESDEKEPEDDDLLIRLDAKYGKLHGSDKREDLDKQFSSWKRINVRPDNEAEESDSDRQSDDPETYDYENITNKDDWKIKEKLDEAQKSTQDNPAHAIKLFDVLLQNYPSSPRSFYGKAQALDALAERKMSNELLQKAITTYLELLNLNQVPDVLFEAAANRCINRMRFVGNYDRTVNVHAMLIKRFPNEPNHRNQLAVSYLTINRVNQARSVLKETLSKYPDDGFALVHYGFILKTSDNNLEESVTYLKKGIATKAPGVLDGRFYFHLGDALARLGQNEEAMKVYEDGVQHKLFFSKYQRSLYNVDRLKGKPWWEKEETPYKKLFLALESNWRKIRDEGLSLLGKTGHFQSESENLRDTGDWKQFELFSRGRKNVENCKKSPITCKIIDSIPDAQGCRRGQTKFSVMHPGTHVWPHCGPTNCRLRVHLGLNVPPNTFIRVADTIRSWENGKVLIFDDSFEHEVWHNGSSFRLILIVDVWHPELTPAEKRKLSPI